jgi:hypothetical protein
VNKNSPGLLLAAFKIIDRLAGLFTQFKSHRPPSLFLPHRCTIRCLPARSDILDPDRDDVATTKFAINRRIEHGKVASATFDLKFRPDRPDVLGPQRWFRSGKLAPVPATRLLGVGLAFT